jgi:hypothetical protein
MQGGSSILQVWGHRGHYRLLLKKKTFPKLV